MGLWVMLMGVSFGNVQLHKIEAKAHEMQLHLLATNQTELERTSRCCPCLEAAVVWLFRLMRQNDPACLIQSQALSDFCVVSRGKSSKQVSLMALYPKFGAALLALSALKFLI